MKKVLTIAASIFFIVGCTVQRLHPVTIGMSEEQFKIEHSKSKIVEMSTDRTVYKDWDRSSIPEDYVVKFYYFIKSKLVLMDEGFLPIGATVRVPTPR
ncbi:hypothetical protein LT679_09045 [Mucilaginibacter roseus]|uniref:Lipoprotein n=1 Tax=Mucilaginibacter roseus TaxID=1528868 RepID=A0ABS8U0V1_9SPHI|nr:hypothetical protein [Mucilaginibacter roseus]MCD8740743.1 hypothetical protein [Mucilaginibacter roseus]